MKYGTTFLYDFESTAPLYGFEPVKSDLKVASLIEGIEAGDTFEPIRVRKSVRNDCYFLLEDGHHRAIAHYIAGAALPCVLYNGVLIHFGRESVRIQDIKLVNEIELAQKAKRTFEHDYKVHQTYRPPRLDLDHVWSPAGPVYSPLELSSSPPLQSDEREVADVHWCVNPS